MVANLGQNVFSWTGAELEVTLTRKERIYNEISMATKGEIYPMLVYYSVNMVTFFLVSFFNCSLA